MIKQKLVENKINLIQTELSRLEEFKDYSFQQIVSDYIKQATVERLLERIIIRALDINQHLIAQLSTKKTEAPRDYKETFLELADLGVYPKEFAKRISKSVGTRNILVHDYDKVDYSQIYDSIDDCLEDYHKYCDYILKYIENL